MNKNIVVLLVCYLLTSIVFGSVIGNTDSEDITNIWHYSNMKNNPTKPLLLRFDNDNWQQCGAVCMVPAYIDRYNQVPILFDDRSERRDIDIPHEVKNITDFGINLSMVTGKIAVIYWQKAEIVVVADTCEHPDTYEHILWSVPIASFLSAPILVEPTGTIFQTLGTKCVLAIGSESIDVKFGEVITLRTKQDVWNFQINLMNSKGVNVDYIIITNPLDTTPDENIKFRGLSLASAPLSAYRHAIVQTGDYAVNRTKLNQITTAKKKIDKVYNECKVFWEKVKNDSYSAMKFVVDKENIPKFMALVGGGFEIPNWYYDFHISYKYWGAKDDYPGSISPYANFSKDVNTTSYFYEDVAIGRIMGHSVLDTTLMLAKTLFYREILPGGEYSNLVSERWYDKGIVLDGHRINQPDPGGPNVTAFEPYMPAGEIATVFKDAGYPDSYKVPRNITDPMDTNPPLDGVLRECANSSVVLLNVHGGTTAVRIELGIDMITGRKYDFYLSSAEVMKLRFAPSIVYCIGCESGILGTDYNLYDYLPASFVHAGSVAYIAPDALQPLCYWEYAPDGSGVAQSIQFFRSLLNTNIPIGMALRDAKWFAANKWKNDSRLDDDMDGLSFILYGDPAFEPYKPKIPFADERKFDIICEFPTVVAPGTRFDVKISVKDLDSLQTISDASVTSKFRGEEITGFKATFKAPLIKGSYQLVVSIKKDGYESCTAKYWVRVPENSILYTLSGVIAVGIVVGVGGYYYIRKRRKKNVR